jgi:hypothetical protein
MKVVAQATKNGVPTPNGEELEKMYLQGWTMLTQVSTNEPLYGKVEYITISHEKMKGLLAPIDDKHYIGIGCAKPCNAEDIIGNAKRILTGKVNA